MDIQTINPATGQLLQSYPTLSQSEVTTSIQQGHEAFLQWRELPITQRSELMLRAADLLVTDNEHYATLISTEMGKPITYARSEVSKCAKVCHYFATSAAEFIKPRHITTELDSSYITYQPLGVIFAIMPWNFPFWQVFRFAAPNLMAGNAALLKHAPIVTGCGLAIETLFRQAGFPKYLFQTLIINEDQASQVIADPLVAGVTLTGSERAGKSVASQAGTHIKKAVLELGGSDPYIILEDADLNNAALQCVKSRLANSGQVCIAAKRFIAVKSIKTQFQNRVMIELNRYQMGNPLDEQVDLGPLAREDLRLTVHQQVQQSVAQGAVLLQGGELPEDTPGFYYPVTVLDQVKKGMPAYDEEIFGPVITLIEAEDEGDAIRIANDNRYGLAAAVFTKDIARGEKIAREQLTAGTCYVNQMVNSDPRLPFGGVKASGFGRELAEIGMHEFMNIKTVGVSDEGVKS
ncbi:MAG TPA: NAD-dependent succinate-semialdehyde dehydrogenase [Gammaproteobacteria bacterium]|nr:NAD-dependent succinate-semialdehyde dehydrogenase [Gammaproteobacteria bacterium]